MDDPHAATETVEAGTPLDEAGTVAVLLHGRGAEAASITPLADTIEGVAVLAPQARDRTWYPERFTAPREDNRPWLDAALARVQMVVERATDHVSLGRVVLAGFSQGACLALEYAASNPARYHGVWGFSGGLIGETLPGYAGDMDGTPVHLACSDHDPHIPVERVGKRRPCSKGSGRMWGCGCGRGVTTASLRGRGSGSAGCSGEQRKREAT